MTKLFKIAIVSLAVLGAASSANALQSDSLVDRIVAEQQLYGQ